MTDTNVVSTGEVWKDVPGFEGKYQASTLGRVRSLDRVVTDSKGVTRKKKGSELKMCPQNKGYLLVTLWCGHSGRKTRTVHSLIAAAFLGEAPKGYNINHINGIKLDNRLANLEYITVKENNRHAIANGLRKVGCKQLGRQNQHSETTVREIRQLYEAGNKSAAIAARFSIAPSVVFQIVTRRTYKWVL